MLSVAVVASYNLGENDTRGFAESIRDTTALVTTVVPAGTAARYDGGVRRRRRTRFPVRRDRPRHPGGRGAELCRRDLPGQDGHAHGEPSSRVADSQWGVGMEIYRTLDSRLHGGDG